MSSCRGFDKVTLSHPDRVAANPTFTVADEYLIDALASIRVLQAHPRIDPARIYLAGHSLGGTLVPRAAAQLRPGVEVDIAPAVLAITAQAGLIDNAAFNASTPAQELPFSVPAPYWLDLLSYDPVGTAALLATPMLILQDGRDYQVTVDDDLVKWQAGLANRPHTTFRIYPHDDHQFFIGTGLSTPNDYRRHNHLDGHVITDIAEWIGTRLPPDNAA